ncbi:MAG: AGE family epimerase/isomerase [Propionibacteriaceae bacterium]|nr:AGE family epimerase/isomerase [Propionibacteriaceae bacterium]
MQDLDNATIADFNPRELLTEMQGNLEGISQFWRERGIDSDGGYHTNFSPSGDTIPQNRKTLIAQTRILWTYSALSQALSDKTFLPLAKHGFDFLVNKFYDKQYKGWYWVIGDERDDPAKLMYGQSFALYSLCAYASASKDQRALELAVETFDAMHKAADLTYGGFWENIDRTWAPEDTDSGRRKSLDIHMHLLESFTALAELTDDVTHRRRLSEIRRLLFKTMIDPTWCIGGNQYDATWTPLEPIVISRTWIAERIGDQALPPGQITTSYGHNLEFGWLLGWADEVLNGDHRLHTWVVDRLADHALRYGFDHEYGGIYREGPPLGPATDQDKEFWQNAEGLIGFLHAYELTSKPQYASAYSQTWRFVKEHMIHPDLHEWCIRTTRTGEPVDSSLGNEWTGGYHTVRAAIECTQRLKNLIGSS